MMIDYSDTKLKLKHIRYNNTHFKTETSCSRVRLFPLPAWQTRGAAGRWSCPD
jgi:hypothetical protein